MWVFTPYGFVSAVADRDDVDGERLLVRARSKGHLVSLFPECEPFSVPGSDYTWRAWINRWEFSDVMDTLVQTISYTNFKNEIREDEYHDACLDVWGAMYRYQQNQDHPKGRRARR